MAELSIERIARSCGVGKAAIYRRWSGKEDLFVEVIRSAGAAAPDLPGTSTRDDLIILLESLRERCLADPASAILRAVQSQQRSNPKIWAAYNACVIKPSRSLGIEAIRRGQTNGEIRLDIDPELAIDTLAAPVLLRLLIHPDANLPREAVTQLVDSLLDGIRSAARP